MVFEDELVLQEQTGRLFRSIIVVLFDGHAIRYMEEAKAGNDGIDAWGRHRQNNSSMITYHAMTFTRNVRLFLDVFQRGKHCDRVENAIGKLKSIREALGQ